VVTYTLCVVALWVYAGYSGWQSAVVGEEPNLLPKAKALLSHAN
jgi:hypothetical protein